MAEKSNPLNYKDNANHQKEGVSDLKSNDCCNCMEGCVFGENVYCSLDGRFHQLHDNIICKSFILNDKAIKDKGK